jgi:flagellar hook assembly protein FlgD
MPGPAEVNLEIFDLKGHRVRRLVQEPKPAGYHAVRWDGKDGIGRAVASGIYYSRVEIKGKEGRGFARRMVRKMILMR